MHVPTITTKRLILRPIREDEYDRYEALINDWRIVRNFTSAFPWPYESGNAKIFFRRIRPQFGKTIWFWVIALKDEPETMIGAIELRLGKFAEENRGFWLGTDYWGNGYMPEAAAATNTFAFQTLRAQKLIFMNARGNHRSSSVKQRHGATLLRCEPRPRGFLDSTFTHAEIWELKAADWLRNQKANND